MKKVVVFRKRNTKIRPRYLLLASVLAFSGHVSAYPWCNIDHMGDAEARRVVTRASTSFLDASGKVISAFSLLEDGIESRDGPPFDREGFVELIGEAAKSYADAKQAYAESISTVGDSLNDRIQEYARATLHRPTNRQRQWNELLKVADSEGAQGLLSICAGQAAQLGKETERLLEATQTSRGWDNQMLDQSMQWTSAFGRTLQRGAAVSRIFYGASK